MKVYHVADWDRLYENNRSREIKKLDWLPIPNRHDGERYSAIWREENGVSLFAAWVLILQVASKCGDAAGGCGRRGTLLRSTGKPHDALSLATITRAPTIIFNQALDYFVNNGWLTVTENPAPSCGAAAPCGGKVPLEGNRTEQNYNTLAPSGQEVSKKPRPRNLLLDKLAELAGIPQSEIGTTVCKRLNKCLSTIKESTPHPTVEEIERRISNYRRQMPYAALTPEALAKHWSSVSSATVNGHSEPKQIIPENLRPGFKRDPELLKQYELNP